MRVRRRVLGICLILFFIFTISGCNKSQIRTVSSQKLIKADAGEIDKIELQGVKENGMGFTASIIDSREKIGAVVKLLSDVKVSKLSAEEENNILDNGKKMLELDSYFINLQSSNRSAAQKTVGVAIILQEEGKLLFVDIDTMQESKRSVSYIGIEENKNKIREIMNILLEK